MASHNVLSAVYVGPGRLSNAFIRRWQRSPASHCEMVTRTTFGDPAAGGNVFECWSASAMDDGVRCKVMRLNPAHWELYRLPFKAEPVREWFIAHEDCDYDLFGLLGFVWRPWRGSRRKFWCSEACAASIGMAEPWRFDVATWREFVRAVGRRVPL